MFSIQIIKAINLSCFLTESELNRENKYCYVLAKYIKTTLPVHFRPSPRPTIVRKNKII